MKVLVGLGKAGFEPPVELSASKKKVALAERPFPSNNILPNAVTPSDRPEGLGAFAGLLRKATFGVVASLGFGFGQALATEPVNVDGIQQVTLANGIPLILVPDQSKKPNVAVAVCYGKGSAIEGPGQQGGAHALEHMKFYGTDAYPDPKLEQSKRQAEWNGFTGQDRVCYFEQMPAGKGHEEWALRFENDRARNTKYDQAGFEHEKTAFLSELKLSYSDPTFLLNEAVLGTAYTFNGYERSAIGNASDVAELKIATIQGLDKVVYQDPKNIVLAVSGDFDAAAVKKVAEETFGTMPQATSVGPGTSKEPVQKGARTVEVEGTDSIARSMIAYHGVAASHPLALAQSALATLLTEEGGPLHRALVATGLVSSLTADGYPSVEPGLLSFNITLADPAKQKQAEGILADVVERIATGKTKISPEALERWRKAELLTFDRTLAERGLGLALTLAGAHVEEGDFRGWLAKREAIEKYCLGDLKDYAVEVLKRSNRTTGSYIPTKDPSFATEQGTIDRKAELSSYRGRSELQGEVRPNSVDALEARTQSSKLGNAADVKLLPLKTEGKFVDGSVIFRTGAQTKLQGGPIPRLLSALLDKGTKAMSAERIQQRLAELDATFSASTSSSEPGTLSISFSTREQYLPQVIALVEELVTKANFPAAQFAQVVAAQRTNLQEEIADGWSVAENAMIRATQGAIPSDPRAIHSLEDQLKQVDQMNVEALRGYWSKFLEAGTMNIAIAGSMDPAVVTGALEASFGKWKTAPAAQLAPLEPPPSPAQQIALDLPGKPSAFVTAGLQVPVGEAHRDYPAFLVLQNILGNFNGPAYHLLRHSGEADTYSVQAILRTEPEAKASVLTVTANSSSAKMVKAQQLLVKLFAELKVDDQLVEVAKGEHGRALQAMLASGTDLAPVMADDLAKGRSLGYHTKLDARVQAVTTADVNRVIDTYLRGPLVQVRAGDLKGKQ